MQFYSRALYTQAFFYLIDSGFLTRIDCLEENGEANIRCHVAESGKLFGDPKTGRCYFVNVHRSQKVCQFRPYINQNCSAHGSQAPRCILFGGKKHFIQFPTWSNKYCWQRTKGWWRFLSKCEPLRPLSQHQRVRVRIRGWLPILHKFFCKS